MYPDQLRSLLADGGIVPVTLQRPDAFCREWFFAEPP
jgi:hypothetical protein